MIPESPGNVVSNRRLPVVVSQGQSHHPAKRRLEDDLVSRLTGKEGVELIVVPHLYDLSPKGATYANLRSIEGDLVVMAWLYERAIHWTLDRHGVQGLVGKSELRNPTDGDQDDDGDDGPDSDDVSDSDDGLDVTVGPDGKGAKEPTGAGNSTGAAVGTGDGKERVIDGRLLPVRSLYCFDLRLRDSADDYVAEVDRLIAARTPRAESAGPSREAAVRRIDESPARRWYPVIDYSRCTNCMECIDFCLFGVYGVDGRDTILVELPDNCRNGCPACSRVCPENAIIFPKHKSPVIAGSPDSGTGIKIDLSQLFGGSNELDVAARERDEHLLSAGRDAVGTAADIPKRSARLIGGGDSDELDGLIDKLDELDV